LFKKYVSALNKEIYFHDGRKKEPEQIEEKKEPKLIEEVVSKSRVYEDEKTTPDTTLAEFLKTEEHQPDLTELHHKYGIRKPKKTTIDEHLSMFTIKLKGKSSKKRPI
jgi:hypothetical protein